MKIPKRRKLLLLIVFLGLAACQSAKPQRVEMPYDDAQDMVEMRRISPCACVDYSDHINLS